LSHDLDMLSDLPGELSPSGMSPRLDAVLDRLPKYQRARVTYGLYGAGIRTLADLCATKRSRLQRLKNVGKRSITNLEAALVTLGLFLAEPMKLTMKSTTKTQTSAQRVTNPVWLRVQIAQLIADCDENIAEDQELADKERDDERRARYEASVDCHRHWKRQLERVLAGKTAIEVIADTLIQQGVHP
jgi:hypothetical protein